ncbi:hypothetical protein DID76_04485 [Candidatus Marinamargulisbacteria bacterium SCGC AG-414-C22]|nr:hypothetical protein DID76_04485 [Candidatus Marinamargulisbacteria bacterium SCGC AG-414-C22]
MGIIEIIGCVAGIINGFAFIPQISKLIKLRESLGVSVFSYSCTVIGCSVWMIYGLIIKSMPIIIFNSFNVLTCVVIIILSKQFSH